MWFLPLADCASAGCGCVQASWGLIHHKGGIESEIKARTGQAWQAFCKHWPRLFGQSHVPLRDKVPLFQSLVLSCLFYGAGTWADVGPRALAPLHRCYQGDVSFLAAQALPGDVLHLTDDRVRALVCVSSLGAWLHFHRLTYLASFVRVDEAGGSCMLSACGFLTCRLL